VSSAQKIRFAASSGVTEDGLMYHASAYVKGGIAGERQGGNTTRCRLRQGGRGLRSGGTLHFRYPGRRVRPVS